jgi:zinc transporter ZupT
MTEGYSNADVWVGVTIGFACAYSVLNGAEVAAEYLAQDGQDDVVMIREAVNPIEASGVVMSPMGRVSLEDDGEKLQQNDLFDQHAVACSVHAINIPSHREHIAEHMNEIMQSIQDIEENAAKLMRGQVADVVAEEMVAEAVDEALHLVQYKLDHCRRLLHGSEYHCPNDPAFSEYRRSWLTEEKKGSIVEGVKDISDTASHLADHLRSKKVGMGEIKEINGHIDEMERHINKFHDVLDSWTWKWKRHDIVETMLGDSIRISLVVPVVIDCFVDGFLIGVSVSLSPKAGFVLAGANCLEMCSLGIAYSSRIAKCTGSSVLSRQLAVISPPLIMFLATGLGVVLADLAGGVGVVYVAFVAFGVYALVALVCCELIIEAHEVEEEEGKEWLNLALFFGIYVVIMLEPLF